jgi:hypothetical protein
LGIKVIRYMRIVPFQLDVPVRGPALPSVDNLEAYLCQHLPGCQQLVRWAVTQTDATPGYWRIEGAYGQSVTVDV